MWLAYSMSNTLQKVSPKMSEMSEWLHEHPEQARQASTDWRRVEACIWFGLEEWGPLLSGGVLAWYWLYPVSGWLFFASVIPLAMWKVYRTKKLDERMKHHSSQALPKT